MDSAKPAIKFKAKQNRNRIKQHMKKLVLLVLTCIGLHSCSKDEGRPEWPVASFETEKTFYDDGDTIKFFNTSKNSVSYSWSFGNKTFSDEPNPEFFVDLKGFLGYSFTADLTAYSAEGLKDSHSEVFTISKRLLLDLHILRMDSSLVERIAQSGQQELTLRIYMGPVGNPLEWIKPEQTIPPSIFNVESGFPQKIHVMRTWPVIAMSNELWFIRFSFEPKGEDAGNSILLKKFQFNPCKTDFILKEDGIRQFVIENEEMEIAIDFIYS